LFRIDGHLAAAVGGTLTFQGAHVVRGRLANNPGYSRIVRARSEGTAVVRRAVADDCAAVLALVPRLVAFGPPPWREPRGMTETDLMVIGEALRSRADDPAIFVAELDRVVVGFLHVHSTVDYYRRRPHGHVADLVVAESSEGLGVAGRLLAEAESWARSQGFDWLSIAVFGDNARAADLYEHHGFRQDTVRLLKPLE
jgi:GNAT superfamily N-acetyltransferase